MIRRRWEDARAKAEAEGACRALTLGGCEGSLETAHTIGRLHDREVTPGVFYVHPDDVVPLCSRHHERYDAHVLDLLPLLDPLGPPYREQAAAVKHVGLERARRRLAPSLSKALDDLARAADAAAELGDVA